MHRNNVATVYVYKAKILINKCKTQSLNLPQYVAQILNVCFKYKSFIDWFILRGNYEIKNLNLWIFFTKAKIFRTPSKLCNLYSISFVGVMDLNFLNDSSVTLESFKIATKYELICAQSLTLNWNKQLTNSHPVDLTGGHTSWRVTVQGDWFPLFNNNRFKYFLREPG